MDMYGHGIDYGRGHKNGSGHSLAQRIRTGRKLYKAIDVAALIAMAVALTIAMAMQEVDKA